MQDVDRWEFFVYAGDRPLAKFVSVEGGAATLERRYLFAPDGTQLAESEAGFETYWILTDGQGSTSNVAQWDGTRHVDAEKSRYDGNGLLRYTETPVGTVDLQLFTRYAGRPYDALVHLADYRGRAYDPVVGRFLTSRPAAAGGNGYANPDGTAELVDPTLTKVADTTWGTAAWQVVGGVGSSIYRGIRDGALDVWDTGKSVFNAVLDPIGTARRIGGAIGAAGQWLAVAWHDPGQAWANVKSGVGAVAQYAWQSFTNDPVYSLARGAFDLFSGAAAAKAATKIAALAKWAVAGAAASKVGSKVAQVARMTGISRNATKANGLAKLAAKPDVFVPSRIGATTWQEYETAIRQLYGEASLSSRRFRTIVDGKIVNGVADNVVTIGGKSIAIEAKFVRDWARSLRNPASPIGTRPFAIAEQVQMLEQAKKYSAAFDEAIYHSNSPELISHYTRLFQSSGITNFRFVLTV